MTREVIYDTETTGTDEKSDRIVELAMVEMIDGVLTGAQWHGYFNPVSKSVHPEAQKVHGITDAFLKDKPFFEDKIDEILEFAGDSPLVAHNAEFDRKFMNAELRRAQRPAIPPERSIDTLAIARKKFPGSPASLDALCKRFRIDNSRRDLHGALIDTHLLADVYVELQGGRQRALELAAAEAAAAGADGTGTATPTRPRRAPRPHAASAEEIAAHQAFLAKKIPDSIWNA